MEQVIDEQISALKGIKQQERKLLQVAGASMEGVPFTEYPEIWKDVLASAVVGGVVYVDAEIVRGIQLDDMIIGKIALEWRGEST